MHLTVRKKKESRRGRGRRGPHGDLPSRAPFPIFSATASSSSEPASHKRLAAARTGLRLPVRSVDSPVERGTSAPSSPLPSSRGCSSAGPAGPPLLEKSCSISLGVMVGKLLPSPLFFCCTSSTRCVIHVGYTTRLACTPAHRELGESVRLLSYSRVTGRN